MENLRGLSVYVYRSPLGDCTNNGVTSIADRFILVDDSINGPFTVKENEIYLVLVRRIIRDSDTKNNEYIHAEPRMNGEKINNCDYGMMGGNFIYCCDSRFPSDYPIPVHDRFENQETYNALSR